MSTSEAPSLSPLPMLEPHLAVLLGGNLDELGLEKVAAKVSFDASPIRLKGFRARQVAYELGFQFGRAKPFKDPSSTQNWLRVSALFANRFHSEAGREGSIEGMSHALVVHEWGRSSWDGPRAPLAKLKEKYSGMIYRALEESTQRPPSTPKRSDKGKWDFNFTRGKR